MEIILENVFYFKNNTALLTDITLNLKSGKTTAIIGQNGAGKTTLLRIIALLDRPSSGKIYYAGQYSEGLRGARRLNLQRKIGYVFQENLFFNGTVLSNLLFPLSVRKIKYETNKIDGILSKLGLYKKKKLDVMALSGGEKKRLQLARVLLFEPDVFVFDEPFSGLDPLSAEIVQNLLTELANCNKTIILSTHNLLQARLFSDEIVFLGKGRIIQTGNPAEIFLRPVSLDIAEFTEAGNILRGEIKIEDGNTFLRAGTLRINIVTELVSGNITALLGPEEIIISKIPVQSSAKNCIKSEITGIRDMGKVVFVETVCDRTSIKVLITRQSLADLELKKNDEVYLVFKATAVHLIPGN